MHLRIMLHEQQINFNKLKNIELLTIKQDLIGEWQVARKIEISIIHVEF